MQQSKISYQGTLKKKSNQNWSIVTCLLATNLKVVSGMKLYRDLGITQKSAWFLVHRLRE